MLGVACVGLLLVAAVVFAGLPRVPRLLAAWGRRVACPCGSAGRPFLLAAGVAIVVVAARAWCAVRRLVAALAYPGRPGAAGST